MSCKERDQGYRISFGIIPPPPPHPHPPAPNNRLTGEKNIREMSVHNLRNISYYLIDIPALILLKCTVFSGVGTPGKVAMVR